MIQDFGVGLLCTIECGAVRHQAPVWNTECLCQVARNKVTVTVLVATRGRCNLKIRMSSPGASVGDLRP